MELPDRLTVVHGVEGRNLVNAHRWHFQSACNFIHDADAGEAVLALAEIEEGHHRGFFVLRWVAFKDFGDEFFIDGIELEWYRGIVYGGISMLGGMALMDGGRSGRSGLDARHSKLRCGEGRSR